MAILLRLATAAMNARRLKLTIESQIRDLVNQLTEPHVEQISVFLEPSDEAKADGAKPGWGLQTVKHDALLAELRGAIINGIGNAGDSTSAGARLPFDPQARMLYDSIESEISALLAETSPATWPGGVYPFIPERALRRWFVEFRAENLGTDWAEGGSKLRRLSKWVASIQAFFDPPASKELMLSCPSCGSRYAIDERSGNRVSALSLAYRVDSLNGVAVAVAVECRAEKRVWSGPDGVDAFIALAEEEPAAVGQ